MKRAGKIDAEVAQLMKENLALNRRNLLTDMKKATSTAEDDFWKTPTKSDDGSFDSNPYLMMQTQPMPEKTPSSTPVTTPVSSRPRNLIPPNAPRISLTLESEPKKIRSHVIDVDGDEPAEPVSKKVRKDAEKEEEEGIENLSVAAMAGSQEEKSEKESSAMEIGGDDNDENVLCLELPSTPSDFEHVILRYVFLFATKNRNVLN